MTEWLTEMKYLNFIVCMNFTVLKSILGLLTDALLVFSV